MAIILVLVENVSHIHYKSHESKVVSRVRVPAIMKMPVVDRKYNSSSKMPGSRRVGGVQYWPDSAVMLQTWKGWNWWGGREVEEFFNILDTATRILIVEYKILEKYLNKTGT